MQLSRFVEKNIFCIEGNWNHNLKDRTGIRTALEFIEHNGGVKHIHKNCSAIEQLETLLHEAMLKRYQKYSIIYLAFHGNPGVLHVAKRKKISIGEIAEILQNKAHDKIIHLGACSTLKVSKWELKRFLRTTGALAISGYSSDIDFLPSTFMDILYFQLCQQYRKVPLIHRDVKFFYRQMAKKLGFEMVYEP